MKTERIIGLLVFLGIFTSAMYFFYPSEYDSIKNTSNLSDESLVDIDSVNSSIQNNNQFKNFDESYFDFFVYRAHILSSKKNANNLKDKINNGGFRHSLSLLGMIKNYLLFMLDLFKQKMIL